MENFFKDQPENDFNIKKTVNIDDGILEKKIKKLNHSYVIENPEYVEKINKLENEISELDKKWLNLTFEFEKIFASNAPNKNFLLEKNQNDINKTIEEVSKKELEIRQFKVNTKKEQFERMIKEN